jgi:cyclase
MILRALSAVLLAAAPLAAAETASEGKLHPLAPDVYAYTLAHDVSGESLLNVSGIVVTSEGLVLFDGMPNDESSQKLRRAAEGLGRGPVRFLVIGSWAPGDRTSGNNVFRDLTLIAHRDARAKLVEFWAEKKEPAPQLAHVTYGDRVELHLGGKRLDVIYLGRGHAPGDAVLHLPDEGIVFASELFFNRVFPGLRTGFSREWVEAIDRIKALNASLIIPGHGDVADAATLRARLEEFRQALVDVRAEVEQLYRAGRTVDEAVQQTQLSRYRDWQLHGLLKERNVRRLYDEFAGRVK